MEAHPGGKEVQPGPVEVYLGAVEPHPGALEAHPGGHGGSSWTRGGHPGAMMGLILGPGRLTLKCCMLIWSRECSPWSRGGSP
jgi:hypothetical protein